MRYIKSAGLLTAIIVLIAACAHAADLTARVNVVLDDGTIMLYAGAKKGIGVGDEFEVTRGGDIVGHIKIIRTKDLFSYAELIDGDVGEMDLAKRTKKGEPPVLKKEKEKKTSARKSTPRRSRAAGDEDEEEAEPERPPRRQGQTASRRRQQAKEDADDERVEREPARESKRRVERKKDEKPEEEKKRKEPVIDLSKTKVDKALEPIGAVRPGGYGLTGLIYLPTADTFKKSAGSAHFIYASADSDDTMFTDLGFGVTYGLGDDIEVAFTMLNSELEANMPLPAGAQTDRKSNIFSFKYQLKNTQPISFFADNVKEARYALGLQFHDTDDVSVPGRDTSSGVESGSSVTRLFGVMTGEYSSGIGHLGLFYQTGDVVDDTDFDGLGITVGVEYPLRKSIGSAEDNMSVLFEFDTKAFYIGKTGAPSLGLRYRFMNRGHATLAIVDVADSAMLTINGAYDFGMKD